MRTALFAVLVALSSTPAWSGDASAPDLKRPAWYKLFPRSFARELITEGHRAFALPVDDYRLGPVRTGDAVDVLVVFDAKKANGSKERFAATVLQNMRVLGVERGDSKTKGTLWLRVNPIEAQYAALAAQQTDLSIALRGPNDVELYPMEMSSLMKLFR